VEAYEVCHTSGQDQLCFPQGTKFNFFDLPMEAQYFAIARTSLLSKRGYYINTMIPNGQKNPTKPNILALLPSLWLLLAYNAYALMPQCVNTSDVRVLV
jgi:hypothetical protein